jgi:hypothetical protein
VNSLPGPADTPAGGAAARVRAAVLMQIIRAS